jgi:hypothetical protein
MRRTAQRVVARYVRDKVDWHGQVARIESEVEDLRELRSDSRKKVQGIRRTLSNLSKSLEGSPLYDDIRRELHRAVKSLDGPDPRTTSFLGQLKYLTGLYDQIGLGLR